MGKYLIISTSSELVRIAPEAIVYISSDGNYSTLMQADEQTRTLTYQLGQIEAMIEKQLGKRENVFIRVGRGIIINRSYIYYINISKPRLVLSDAKTFSHTVSVPKDALKQLKELIEKEGM